MMTDAEVLAVIRTRHLKANIGDYEKDPPVERVTVHWDRAWLDPGGTLFGPGPYAKVPISLLDFHDEIVVRVYPPAALRRRLAREWQRPIDEAGIKV